MALGAAKQEAGRFYALLKLTLPAADQAVTSENFHFRFDRARLRVVRRREGRYLLRSNLTNRTPAELWTCHMQVEEAFKNLKGDLGVRPVFHQKMERIEDSQINMGPWITHQAAFEDMIGGFPSWTQPETGVIKAAVAMD